MFEGLEQNESIVKAKRGTAGSAFDRVIPLGLNLGLYKIFVYFKVFVHERIIHFWPLPICIAHTIAILFQTDCAIHDLTPGPLLYTLHHPKWVLTITCEGQVKPLGLTLTSYIDKQALVSLQNNSTANVEGH